LDRKRSLPARWRWGCRSIKSTERSLIGQPAIKPAARFLSAVQRLTRDCEPTAEDSAPQRTVGTQILHRLAFAKDCRNFKSMLRSRGVHFDLAFPYCQTATAVTFHETLDSLF
jgi:hypothetical protein